MKPSRPSYSDVLLSCLDRALNIVGQSGRQVVYEALENRYGVKREQVSEHPEYLLKIMKVYLGSASEPVEKEALYWIKQDSGIDANSLVEAIEALKREYTTEVAPDIREAAVPPTSKWKLESHTRLPEGAGEGEAGLYRYSARFSFGPPPTPKDSDPESREALEAYLKGIVERHTRDKKPAE